MELRRVHVGCGWLGMGTGAGAGAGDGDWEEELLCRHSRESGNPVASFQLRAVKPRRWVPAFAGMTVCPCFDAPCVDVSLRATLIPHPLRPAHSGPPALGAPIHPLDRKSVVSGKSVSYREDFGGSRIITK